MFHSKIVVWGGESPIFILSHQVSHGYQQHHHYDPILTVIIHRSKIHIKKSLKLHFSNIKSVHIYKNSDFPENLMKSIPIGKRRRPRRRGAFSVMDVPPRRPLTEGEAETTTWGDEGEEFSAGAGSVGGALERSEKNMSLWFLLVITVIYSFHGLTNNWGTLWGTMVMVFVVDEYSG